MQERLTRVYRSSWFRYLGDRVRDLFHFWVFGHTLRRRRAPRKRWGGHWLRPDQGLVILSLVVGSLWVKKNPSSFAVYWGLALPESKECQLCWSRSGTENRIRNLPGCPQLGFRQEFATWRKIARRARDELGTSSKKAQHFSRGRGQEMDKAWTSGLNRMFSG